MKVQFIYTFENTPQVITEYNDLWKAFITSKDVFLSYAMSVLDTYLERETLVKISCCIAEHGKIKLPQWYADINGKFWIDDLDIWRYENGFESKIDNGFIKDFNTINNKP